MEKHIEIGGVFYTLTPTRKLIKTVYNIAPDFLKMNVKNKEANENVSIELLANLDVLFFDLIRVAHPQLSKEDSDIILKQFSDEYADVDNAIITLAMSVFTEGNKGSANKKKINW